MGCQNNTNRLIHFDLMRIIACFLVVLIHVGIFDQLKDVPNQSIDTVFGNLYGIISRWAVPCFFMLSGLMFLDKNKEIPLKKRKVGIIFAQPIDKIFNMSNRYTANQVNSHKMP